MTPPPTTIAAALTARTPGAIGVIAVHGPNALQAVGSFCRTQAGQPVHTFSVDAPRLFKLVDGEQTIDDALVVYSVDDESQSVELCPHGGVRIIERVLAALESTGVRVVTGTEYMDRVASDPLLRDVDRALIPAGSRRMAHWLLAQRRLLPDFLRNWSSHDATAIESFRNRTRAAIRLVRGIRMSIIGPPNAGKSTLANRLIGHDRVITSDVAGTTRDWIDETAAIDGWPVTLTDTAGLRTTECEIESEAIRRATDQARLSDFVIILLDATASSDETYEAQVRAESALDPEQQRLIVTNKSDASDASRRTSTTMNQILISARTGDGIEELERRIAAALGLNVLESDQPTGFLSEHLDGQSATPTEHQARLTHE